MPQPPAIVSLLLPAMLLAAPVYARVTVSSDAETGLKTWTLSKGALKLQLVQRLPDQTRAFFLARGFPSTTADSIANSCVFQLIGMNASRTDKPVDVRIDLSQWRVLNNGKATPPKLKSVWAQEWGDDVPMRARIAFRWATFPTDQIYHPADDYNWGMLSLGPAPGTTIDLNVVWFEDGSHQSSTITGITCPADPKPGTAQ